MNKQRLAEKRQLIQLIRRFFDDNGFTEIETPLLVPSPGMETHLHGFKTKYLDNHDNEQELYLPTSPEFAIKKALGGGYEKVYEIARVFRNMGELGPQHHPEFNMLEWYRPGGYEDVMDDVDSFLLFISQNFPLADEISGFDWGNGSRRTTLQVCFEDYTDLDLTRGMLDQDYWRSAAEDVLQENVPEDDSFEDVFFRVWMKMIEPQLGVDGPQIVYDYPASMSALAQLKASDTRWAERFELYINGVEIGNAFSELRDADEQRLRFENANKARKRLGYEPHPIDEDLIQAVTRMKPTGGIAMGVERLLMVLTGESDIRQFFLQPLTEARRK